MKRETLRCDVLIVGGGVGGLACAASVKERMPGADVLVVEKNFAGYAGKANRGGGVLQYFDPQKVKPEDFLRFHAKEIGCYLGNQPLMLRYVEMNPMLIESMERWGVNVPREADGSFRVRPTGPLTAMISVDLDLCLRIRRFCEKAGVRFLDKVVMSDLLTGSADPGAERADAVCGALCYSVLDGTLYVIAARQVVLATGGQNYRLASMWSSGRGDGIAAAYRAGAKLRNVEFGNFAQLMRVRSHNEMIFAENNMYNGKGEFITPNFRSRRETDINSNVVQEWYKQMRAGNGPVTVLDPRTRKGGAGALAARGLSVGQRFRALNEAAADAVDGDGSGGFEVCPMLIGEQSPVCTDEGMRTSLKGLYAIGDCSYAGSAVAGAVPAPPGRNRGSGILNAVFAAIVCGESVQSDAPAGLPVDASQVAKLTADLLAPLERAAGCAAEDVIEVVHQAMCPAEYSIIMTEARIHEALKLVLQAKELLPALKARDWHELMCCHEAEAMVLSAELHYRASLLRKESRGWFLREDYPARDDENWLKWIEVENRDGEMRFTAVRLPIEDWPVQPEGFSGAKAAE